MISAEELFDLMDAIHNIPGMLRNYGGWNIEQNLDTYLEAYDKKWLNQKDHIDRTSLMKTIDEARKFHYPRPENQS